MHLELDRLKVVGSMPVHHTVHLGKGDLHQPAATRPASARAGIGPVGGAMGGAYQPLAGDIEKTVGLVIHLYRHVRATVQVGVRLVFEPDRKGTAGLPPIDHIKGDGEVAFL